MQYLEWRVLAGLNHRIEISFMMVGHTKFAPDWAFGLLKQKFKRTQVGCLDDLANMVSNSASVNHAQLVGLEDGTIIVPQYDWASFFQDKFKRQAFEGIKSLHHLVFSADRPGEVVVRKTSDGLERVLSVLNKNSKDWKPSPLDMPPVIKPPGLSRERQAYLFEKIREFCPDYSKDIVCPNPNSPQQPLPSSSPSPPSSPSQPAPPSSKRQRLRT